MKLVLTGETEQRLEMTGEEFEIVSEGVAISPYHLFAGSLSTCIGMLVRPWSRQIDVDPEGLTVTVSWKHEEAEDDRRISRVDVELRWPELPEERRDALERVARTCPVHETLEEGTEVATRYAG